jgi:hypothetical protein
VACAQAAINGPGLAIDIAGLIASEEQGDTGNLIRMASPLRRVQLANFLGRATAASRIVHGRSHAGLDETRADGVYADTRSSELVRDGLGKRHNGGLGSRVGRGAGVGADAGHGGGADDAAAGSGFLGRGLHHGWCCVLGSQEDAQRIDLEHVHEITVGKVGKQHVLADDAGVSKEDVETAIALDGIVDNSFHLGLIGGVQTAGLNLDIGTGGINLLLVGGEVGVVQVTQVDGASTALGVLVSGCPADAEGGVGALPLLGTWKS